MIGTMCSVLAGAALLAADAFAQSDCETMEREAIDFISHMPRDLQDSQERAVRLAMRGDMSALEAVRKSRNGLTALPEGVSATDIEGKYRLYVPARSGSLLPVLVYLHGGGWCFGSINSCVRFCSELVSEGGIAVLAVEYPLAPENPYPAPLDCCVKAVCFAFEHASEYGLDPKGISIGGDSAGGNLAMATALRLVHEKGMDDDVLSDGRFPDIRSLVLFYPVVKVWNDGSDSWIRYGKGFGLDGSIMEAFNEAYVGTDDPALPFISPYCAPKEDLAQLPSVLIVNADHDILRDQGGEMYARLREAGVAADREVLPGTTHLFITVPGQPTAFRRAVMLAACFLADGSRE